MQARATSRIVNGVTAILEKSFVLPTGSIEADKAVYDELTNACAQIAAHNPAVIPDTLDSLLRIYQCALNEDQENWPSFISETFHRDVIDHLVPEGHLSRAISIIEHMSELNLPDLKYAATVNILRYVRLANLVCLFAEDALGIAFKFAREVLKSEQLDDFCDALEYEMQHFGCYWMQTRLFALIVMQVKENQHRYFLRALSFMDAASVLKSMRFSEIKQLLQVLAAADISFLTLHRYKLLSKANLQMAEANPYCTRAIDVCSWLNIIAFNHRAISSGEAELIASLMCEQDLAEAITVIGEVITSQYKTDTGIVYVPADEITPYQVDINALIAAATLRKSQDRSGMTFFPPPQGLSLAETFAGLKEKYGIVPEQKPNKDELSHQHAFN